MSFTERRFWDLFLLTVFLFASSVFCCCCCSLSLWCNTHKKHSMILNTRLKTHAEFSTNRTATKWKRRIMNIKKRKEEEEEEEAKNSQRNTQTHSLHLSSKLLLIINNPSRTERIFVFISLKLCVRRVFKWEFFKPKPKLDHRIPLFELLTAITYEMWSWTWTSHN